MNNFTDFEHIAIENAYEELLIILKEQGDDKEFSVLQSMVHLRKSGLGYRKISDEIKNKFGKRIYFPQVHKILNRPHNLKLLELS